MSDSSNEQQQHHQQQQQYQSMAVLQHSIKRFIDLTELESRRLAQHQTNLRSLHAGAVAENRAQVSRELINSSRCVQQLKVRLRELQQLRARVAPGDLVEFDARVCSTVQKAKSLIRDFTSAYIDATVAMQEEGQQDQHEQQQQQQQVTAGFVFDDKPSVLAQQIELGTTMNSLANDLQDLEQVMHNFGQAAREQGGKLASIEANVSSAAENVDRGRSWLISARQQKASLLPVASAATAGLLLAGPVGFLAGGYGAAAAAGLLGGVAGFAGGRWLKWRPTDEKESVEMRVLDRGDSG